VGKLRKIGKKVLILHQKQLLPTFEADPDKLVGKKIKHKCRDPVSKTVEWFIEWLWHFPLLKDMENGDIIINS
jgi:hypothetical protein